MTKKYQSFPGMDDILPGEVEKWQWLEEKARIFFEAHGFREIRTPLLEPTELFVRSIGEASDIVHKEMYTFEDRGGRSMTLRPEMTASVARSVIEKGLLKTNKSLRLYYLGPMFRAERPQAGRKRQFHQIGIEMINESGAQADFEAIALLYHFLKYVGIETPKLRLNDLSALSPNDPKSNSGRFQNELFKYFQGHRQKLCEDCQYRLEKNVMRIFDCKVAGCQSIINQAPWNEISPFSADFETLLTGLNVNGILYEVNRRLVRGLDYYNGAVFEIVAEGLGAQDAVAGGGRYDRLYEELGSSHVPCTGFSIGMERLLASLDHAGGVIGKNIRARSIYIALIEPSKDMLDLSRRQAISLRERGFRIFYQPGSFDMKTHLKRANQLEVRYMLILGNDEMQKQKWNFKDLDARAQSEIEMNQLISYLEGVVGK